MRKLTALFLLLSCVNLFAQEEVIRLYKGAAPGSEDWNYSEQVSLTNLWQARLIFNVVNPTLTVFRPDAKTANGTGVVICPGGGFFALGIDSEGFDVARWLAKKGFTCFVLKYRLVHCKTSDPTTEIFTRGNLDEVVAPTVKLALEDGKTAIGYLRMHAKDYDLKPDRIGIIGFSAGGTVATSVAFNYTPETRPNFVAPIYPAYKWAIKDHGVPSDAPPMFILAATDDPFKLAPESVALYHDWTAANKSAELHVYSVGGHGFGMKKQYLPSDDWIRLFADWLALQGRK